MENNLQSIMKNNKVEVMKLSDIQPDPMNSRVHDVHNIEIIKRSLQRFGQYRPFVIQKSNHYIRVGNGMYQAMLLLAKQQEKQLSEVQVNCIVLDLDDDSASALSILDNKSSDLSYNDNARLGQLFKNMSQENIELTGFSNQQVTKILQTFNVNVQDIVNPVQNVKTQEQKKEQKAKNGILMYKLIFENESQKNVWQKFINEVKSMYGESVCESLKMFIVDYYKQSGKNVETF